MRAIRLGTLVAFLGLVLGVLLGSGTAVAHVLTVIPDNDIVPADGAATVTFNIAFTHPMERGPVMDLAPLVHFSVVAGEKRTLVDLLSTLTPVMVDGKRTYTAKYTVTEPGDHVFYAHAKPYWEASEKKWLLHYSKIIVSTGGGTTWKHALSLPVEIIPLTRPYGLWTGNVFQAQMLEDGRPVPYGKVEVEWANDGSVKAPSAPFVTQELRTDGNGVFTYGLPRAGWWAFTGITARYKSKPGPNEEVSHTEVGGTTWIRAVDMK